MERQIVILLGHPGVGKGTQAREIMRCLNIPQISTGDMLRDAMSRQTSLGKEVQERMHAGQFVSDTIVNEIVAERILRADCAAGFILDGYPRTVQQAERFQNELRGDDRLFVIELFANAAGIIDRLIGRRICAGCGDIYNVYSRPPLAQGVCDQCGAALTRRSDDRADLIRGRFRQYDDETYPLVDHYRKTGCCYRVDGMPPITDVTKEILGILDVEEALTASSTGGKKSLA